MTILSASIVPATIFQLTSSRRGWLEESEVDGTKKAFQLTSSRRGWRFCLPASFQLQYFNSHPHEEDDLKNPKLMEQRKHFNSHPHEEDDRAGLQHLLPSDYFNSHPHEEDDEKGKTYKEEKSISTHILTKRMTKHPYHLIPQTLHFNSHPHEEDDWR